MHPYLTPPRPKPGPRRRISSVNGSAAHHDHAPKGETSRPRQGLVDRPSGSTGHAVPGRSRLTRREADRAYQARISELTDAIREALQLLTSEHPAAKRLQAALPQES